LYGSYFSPGYKIKDVSIAVSVFVAPKNSRRNKDDPRNNKAKPTKVFIYSTSYLYLNS